MQDFTDVKLEIFVPQEYALKICDQLAKIGVGRLGDYDHFVRRVHPYEEPLVNIIPLANHLFDLKSMSGQ